jgi:hypothetical protein
MYEIHYNFQNSKQKLNVNYSLSFYALQYIGLLHAEELLNILQYSGWSCALKSKYSLEIYKYIYLKNY